jgi:hypothetical protein
VLTSVIDIRDDDSACSNATYSDTDSEDSVHANEKLVQPNEETMLELQRMSMWEQSTLQATGKLAGDPLDFRRTRSSMWILLMYFQLLNNRKIKNGKKTKETL